MKSHLWSSQQIMTWAMCRQFHVFFTRTYGDRCYFPPGSSDRRSSLTCPPPQVGLLVFLLHALQAEVAKVSKADGGLLQRRSYSQDHDGAPLLGEQGTGDNTGHFRLWLLSANWPWTSPRTCCFHLHSTNAGWNNPVVLNAFPTSWLPVDNTDPGL